MICTIKWGNVSKWYIKIESNRPILCNYSKIITNARNSIIINFLLLVAGEFLNNEGSGLYLLQSKINHSCVPNAQSTFPYSNDIVVLKATQIIQPGEEICISYLDECLLERSRHTRQKILKENYIFLCQCMKCQLQSNDPDETSEDEDDDEDDMDMEDDDDMDD